MANTIKDPLIIKFRGEKFYLNRRFDTKQNSSFEFIDKALGEEMLKEIITLRNSFEKTNCSNFRRAEFNKIITSADKLILKIKG